MGVILEKERHYGLFHSAKSGTDHCRVHEDQ